MKSTEGLWNLWYNPVPSAPLAKDVNKPNIPIEQTKNEEPQEEPQGAEELHVQVDESQFKEKTIQQKLNSSLDDLVDEDNKVHEREGSVSSRNSEEKAYQEYDRNLTEQMKDMDVYCNRRTDYRD